jgi:DNA-binding transcriptional MerR regulator
MLTFAYRFAAMTKRNIQSGGLKVLAKSVIGIGDLKNRRYTVRELRRITGISPKQVIHWSRIRLLVPSWRDPQARGGRPAVFYSAKDVLKALIICEMKQKGLAPSEVLEAAQNLERLGIRLDESARYLLTDGFSVYYAETDSKVVDILRNNNQMLLIPIHEQVQKLTKVA